MQLPAWDHKGQVVEKFMGSCHFSVATASVDLHPGIW